MKKIGKAKNKAADIANALNYAVTLHQAGRLDEARTAYQQILRTYPQHPVALHFMGMLAFQTGDHKVAIEFTDRSIKADPTNPLYFYNQAIILRSQGNLLAAVDRYRRAVALKHDYLQAHFNLGHALTSLGNSLLDMSFINEAEASFRRVLKLSPSSDAYQNLGVVLQNLGRVDEALECFKMSLDRATDWEREIHRLTSPLVLLDGMDLKSEKAPRHAEGGQISCSLTQPEPSSTASFSQSDVAPEGGSEPKALKIVLIYPPLSRRVEAPLGAPSDSPKEWSVDDLNGDAQTITYGLLTIAAQAKRDGHDVRVYNLAGTPWQQVEDLIAKTTADVFGISAFNLNRLSMGQLAKLIRKLQPETHITVGGPFATALPKDTLRFYRDIDTVVIGEGEETFIDLLSCVASGRPTAGIPGTAWRDGENIMIGPKRPRIDDLDALAPPFDHFSSKIVITSRGCPSKCTFCGSFSTWGRKVRFHSVNYCLDMFKKVLAQLPFPVLSIKDDTFTADRRRAIAICDAIIESKLNFIWSCDTRVDCLEDELLRKMRLAGCQMISFGVESGAPEILKTIRKDTTPEKVLEATRAARKYGFFVRYYMILPNRGETIETIEKSTNLIKAGRPDEYAFSLLTINPGTEEWEIFSREQGVAADIYFNNDFSELSVDINRKEIAKELLYKVMCDVGTVSGFHYTVEEREAVIDLLPGLHTARVDLANAYLRAGRLEDAKTQLDKAEELGFPVGVIIQNQRACISLAEQNYKNALSLLEGCVQSLPSLIVRKNYSKVKAWVKTPPNKRGKLPLLDDSVNAIYFT